ncbi:MAG: hypothetical protein ACK4RV_02355 [Caulobacter sp.]
MNIELNDAGLPANKDAAISAQTWISYCTLADLPALLDGVVQRVRADYPGLPEKYVLAVASRFLGHGIDVAILLMEINTQRKAATGIEPFRPTEIAQERIDQIARDITVRRDHGGPEGLRAALLEQWHDMTNDQFAAALKRAAEMLRGEAADYFSQADFLDGLIAQKRPNLTVVRD